MVATQLREPWLGHGFNWGSAAKRFGLIVPFVAAGLALALLLSGSGRSALRDASIPTPTLGTSSGEGSSDSIEKAALRANGSSLGSSLDGRAGAIADQGAQTVGLRYDSRADGWVRNSAQSEGLAQITAPPVELSRSWEQWDSPAAGSQHVGTPEVATAGCGAKACRSQSSVSSRTVTVPGFEGRDVATRAVPVSRTCAGLACVGPFTIPSQTLLSTQSSPSHTIATPGVTVGPLCGGADFCSGHTLLEKRPILATPSIASMGMPGGSLNLRITGLSGSVAPGTGEAVHYGPIELAMPLPGVGAVPVVVCPEGCDFPKIISGKTYGEVTLTMKIGQTNRSVAVPITLTA
jgi:hypothetical protein